MLYNLFKNRDFVSVFAVALLAEGVDRNIDPAINIAGAVKSPSSRRAWIEIWQRSGYRYSRAVALLAEGVDRNLVNANDSAILVRRPPRGGRG